MRTVLENPLKKIKSFNLLAVLFLLSAVFLNWVDRSLIINPLIAKSVITQLPTLSWYLLAVLFILILLNHRLMYTRSVAGKSPFYLLEEQLELQNALLNSAHQAIITFSTTGIITSFSACASQTFGYQADEIIGKSICQLIAENASVYCSDCFKSRLFSVCFLMKIQTKHETQGLRKNGEVFPLLLKFEELKTARQHLFICFLSDLTAEKAAELKLVHAKQEAEQSNKAKSQFLSNISHELKTPLNAILGFSQLLETDEVEPLTFEQTECVQHIYKAGKLLLALIGDVLDLSKIETGNVSLNFEDVSVNEVILEALSLIENIAKEHHITIKTRFDPLATTMIHVDSLRFKQILINLLSNAIKYNSENGQIVLRSKVEKNRVKISVKDSGQGIDESKLMELFQPFNRVGAENSTVEGTGIGLCIAKNLVERMGGTIGAMNNKDSGCCFWVEFPVVAQKIISESDISESAKRLQNELHYLQESLVDIGLVKTQQVQNKIF